jgi:M6 family metalloprotease-like protein
MTIEVLVARYPSFLELIRQSPAEAIELALTGREVPAIPAEGQNLLETEQIVLGPAEHIVEDRFDTTIHIYHVQSASGPITIYTESESGNAILSGQSIRAKGVRLGTLMAASDIEWVGDATDPREPTYTGDRRVAVLLANFPEWPQPNFDSDQVAKVFFGSGGKSAAAYMEKTSGSRLRITGEVYGWYTLNRSHSCDELDSIMNDALNAADPDVKFTDYDFVYIIHPTSSGCRAGGRGSLGRRRGRTAGDGEFYAGIAWHHVFPWQITLGSYESFLGTITHELGHNLGLSHAGGAKFGTVPMGYSILEASSKNEYWDPFSVMGSSDGLGSYSAVQKLQIGWLSAENVQEVTNTGTFSLAPLYGNQAVQTLKIRRWKDQNQWIWLEYRQLTGEFQPAWPSELASNLNGALMRTQELNRGSEISWLIDFTPDSLEGLRSFDDAALLVGRSWSDPYSLWSVHVSEASPEFLKVDVVWDTPCITLGVSNKLIINSRAQSLQIPVVIAEDCQWTSLAKADWISLQTNDSEGTDRITVQIGENAAFQRRTALVFIGRQRIVIEQAGAARQELPFTMDWYSGFSARTDGHGELIQGYGRIQPDAGQKTPGGVAIFGSRQKNTLVSEAAVPASSPLRNGRIYAELGGAVNTGIAFANPNAQEAVIRFYFTTAAGVDFSSGELKLPPNGHNALMLNDPPFSILNSFQGSWSFTSNVPIAVIALRTFVNENSELLMTTLPVVDTTSPPPASVQYIPHFADGNGIKTQVLLINPTDSPISGTIQFFGPGTASLPATAVNIRVGNQFTSSYRYSIPRRSSFKLATDGNAAALTHGSVRVQSASGSASPVPLVIFTYKSGGFTRSEAGVPAVQGWNFRIPAEFTGSWPQPESTQTGIAIVNTSSNPTVVRLWVTKQDGYSLGPYIERTIPASGQLLGVLSDFFPELPTPFVGQLGVVGSFISVIAIRGRYNELGNYLMTTIPPVDIDRPSGELYFPHVVNGNGFSTELILLTINYSTRGAVRFFQKNGSAMQLPLD